MKAAATSRAHGHGRKRPPCSIPGCAHRALYACARVESGAVHADSPSAPGCESGGTGGAAAASWYCKAHKGRCCVRVGDDNDNGADWERPAAGAVDAARIAETARASLVRMQQDAGAGGTVDPYAAYGFRAILELCGAVHGEVHVCACGHPLSSHRIGVGRCMDCGAESPCHAMRRRHGSPPAPAGGAREAPRGGTGAGAG